MEWPPTGTLHLHSHPARHGALSPRHQERMAARLGAAVRIVSLDTCHYPMLQRPEQVATLLNEVAEQVVSRAA